MYLLYTTAAQNETREDTRGYTSGGHMRARSGELHYPGTSRGDTPGTGTTRWNS